MKQPTTQTVYDLFNSRIQFVVPAYQRAYVWNEEENWSILWDDIIETAQRYLDDPKAGHEHRHFLGPIVVEQQHYEVGGVDPRLVIDGQQRLTTLQVLLSVTADVADQYGVDQVANDLRDLTRNSGRKIEGSGVYKVQPSRRDHKAFLSAMSGNQPASRHGLSKAYEYFQNRISEWVTDNETGESESQRLEALGETLESLLYVVAINLDETDNAQVIFETLNARGTGLGALDLVKNAAFLNAEREGADTMELHDEYWEPTFESDDYWNTEARQGRQKRDRADWFLRHWLGMRLGEVVRVDKLFETFRRQVLRGEGIDSMDMLVPELCRDARIMRSFDDFEPGTPEALFFSRLDAMDTTTLLPVALLLFRSPEVSPERRRRAIDALESWLVRRAVLRYTTRNYNRLLTDLIQTIKADLELADEKVIAELRSSDAATAVWPDDEAVLDRLTSGQIYNYISRARIRMILEACELATRDSAKTEPIDLPAGLTIEHAMPVKWKKNWPIHDGDDEAETARNQALHRLGNLTLVTQGLNSAMSNAPWIAGPQDEFSKRNELSKRSVLLINQRLCMNDTWNEEKIDERSAELADLFLQTWPGPDAAIWDEGPIGLRATPTSN